MEQVSNIAQFLEGKSLLVTGATGFLAKVLLEKILRVQPNIGKIFLLMRVENTESCRERLHNEILEKDLFRVLKMKWGESFSLEIAKKVVAVPGDISYENLGIQDPYLRDAICREVDVFINLAAITKFDERYDVALDTNTFGALNVLNLAKKCPKCKVVLQVSTAYVCKESDGNIILEEPLWKSQPPVATTKMPRDVGGASYLDIDEERKVSDAKLRELHDANADPQVTRSAMKDLGIQRARMHGWANTYVFTKAMGEMLLEKLKEKVEVVILRPTIITSTYMEPFPGWIEGVRTVDSIMIAYGKGKLKCYVGDPEAILDLIPGDMVVNCILATITAHATHDSRVVGHHIYHVGSSGRNPLKFGEIVGFVQSYFINNPWVGSRGKAVKVKKFKIFDDMNKFHKQISTPYLPFLKVLKLLNIMLCQHLDTIYTNTKSKINYVARLADLYLVYVFFRIRFDDANTKKLQIISSNDSHSFNFDMTSIEWKEYIMNIHIPGAIKYIF